MLLRRGADASAEDKSKCNAAFLARRAEWHECQQILAHHMKERISTLASQAILGTLDGTKVYPSDVCQVTQDGETLLILAAKYGHAHLLSQLVLIDDCPLDYQQMKVKQTSLWFLYMYIDHIPSDSRLAGLLNAAQC